MFCAHFCGIRIFPTVFDIFFIFFVVFNDSCTLQLIFRCIYKVGDVLNGPDGPEEAGIFGLGYYTYKLIDVKLVGEDGRLDAEIFQGSGG